jgi:carboxyl-terminal processing protease
MTETTARSIPLQIVQGDSPSAAPLQAGVKQLGGDKINRSPVQFADAPVLRKPSWIRVRIPSGNAVQNLKAKLRENRLVTVCEEASCPNIHECFGHGTATFMILGEVCTRRCSFCDVAHGRPKPPDANEPASLGQTVADMGLKYVVVTSVDRDDLRDGGAQHFVDCITAIREKSPGTRIEVLTPDFRGKGRMERALEILAQNPPDVFNHNIETVPDLYRNVRPGADYQWSLNLLKNFKAQHPDVPTKSGIMLGLGEDFEQIKATMRDLRAHDVDMITIGQYLQPTAHHHPVLKYWTPEDYKALEDYGYELGFSHVASGPMVRSSYHADVQAKGAGVCGRCGAPDAWPALPARTARRWAPAPSPAFTICYTGPARLVSTERGRVTNPATFGTVVVSEHPAVSPWQGAFEHVNEIQSPRIPDGPGAGRAAGAGGQGRLARIARGGHRRSGDHLQAGVRPAVRQPLRLPPARAGRGHLQGRVQALLETLDGGKQYFTQADVARFAPFEANISSAIRGGELEPAFQVFAVYKQRVGERVAYARKLLKQEPDFTTDERFEYDRKKVPWAASSAELDELWRKSVKNDWLRLKLAGKKPDDIRKTLDKRYATLEKSVNELKGEDVFQFFMNAYTSAVDPHTDYFTPRTAENFNQAMSLSLEGIGAQLQRQDDVVVIREIIAGGPAAVDGTLKPGDRIVGVGQGKSGLVEDVIGWRIDDVVAKIRGAKDTQVKLEFIPAAEGADGKHHTLVLTRQKVRLAEQAAKGETMTIPAANGEPARKIGVIKLPTFYQDFEGRRRNAADYASATRDVAKLLAGFKNDKLDGVVLDLRNNGGGSLDEAIELTGLFIEQGPVVQVRESGGRVTVNSDRNQGVAWDGPLAVLINRGSASASEIFAGAIQDYGRGLVIGETSFGKGTVQNIVDLDRWPSGETQRFGQVKLTIAQFFRISGSSTQHKGVVPDLAFPASVDATEFGESTYDNALPWTRIAAVPHTQYGNFAPLLPKLETRHDARIATDKEFQWWNEDVQQFRTEAAKKYISLNEATRRAERERQDAQRKERQVQRKELGLALDPLADDSSDDGLTGNERDIVKDAAREKAAEKRPDPLLRESASILADAVNLLANDRPLSAQVLPQSTGAGRWAD